MANPILADLQNNFSERRNQFPQSQSRLTLDDVLMKTLAQFAVLVPVAVATFIMTPPVGLSMLAIGAGIAALAVSFIIGFAKRPPVFLIFIFAVLEGVMVGALSKGYSLMFDGIITTALISTTVTAIIIIAGVRAGFLKTSGAFRKFFGYAILGYIAFHLIALGAAMLGHSFLTFGSPLALVVSGIGVLLASFALVTDVEDIRDAVNQGLPQELSWRLSFGLVVSLVWLYMEILRLIANIRSIGD